MAPTTAPDFSKRFSQTVPATAGVSTQETVVEQVLDCLRAQFGATVEPPSMREEEDFFPLPRELRRSTAKA